MELMSLDSKDVPMLYGAVEKSSIITTEALALLQYVRSINAIKFSSKLVLICVCVCGYGSGLIDRKEFFWKNMPESYCRS